MRLIALWVLGGPVLQMGGGSTRPGVTLEVWRSLQSLGRTEQRDQTVGLERGGWSLSFRPWDAGVAKKPKWFGCDSYQSLGKPQISSIQTPLPGRVKGHSVRGHESFHGVGKKWSRGPFLPSSRFRLFTDLYHRPTVCLGEADRGPFGADRPTIV